MATLADIVAGNANGNGTQALDVLLAALEARPELLAAASDPNADLTVFAPTDDAFIALAQVFDPSVSSEGEAVAALVGLSAKLSPSNDPTAFLANILTYHISPGGKLAAEVSALPAVETLQGTDIIPDGTSLGDQEPALADPNLIGGLTDLGADNGVAHAIDGVLSPVDFTFGDGGLVFTGRGSDAFIGSDHRDTVFLGRDDDFAYTGDGNDKAFGGRGNDVINTGDGHDRAFGGRDDDFVNGGDGNDYVSGGRGNDWVEGGDGNDHVRGGRDNDHVFGGDGYDRVFGNSGNDWVDGGDGNDYVSGGRGEDHIIGGSGNDYLKGGRDADKFVFNPFNPDEGHDIVKDFSLKQGDKLVLDLREGDPEVLAEIQALNDPGKVEVQDLVDAGVVTLGETKYHSLEIEHPGGTIGLLGVSSDVDVATLETAVEFWTV